LADNLLKRHTLEYKLLLNVLISFYSEFWKMQAKLEQSGRVSMNERKMYR